MNGAFRDASAAVERAAMLEGENEELRLELEKLLELKGELNELVSLREEVKQLRAIARGENEQAFLRRLTEERDELRGTVDELRQKILKLEREATSMRRQLKQDPLSRLETWLEGFRK